MKYTVETIVLLTACTTLALAPVPSHASERELGAHEHGVSTLKIAQENNTILFELEAPGKDIVGFEHAAENDDQMSAVKDALAQLNKPEAIFVLPVDANCVASKQNAEFETEDDHAGFHVTWTMTCEKPAKASSIVTQFFDMFERAEEIEVEAVGNAGQSAAEVEKGQKSIDLSQAIGG